jgi:Tfp pilus assembly protein PilN
MIRVNLLAGLSKSSTNSSTHQTDLLPGAIFLFVVTAAGLGVWLWALDREIAVVDARIARTEADLNGLKRADQLTEQAKSRKTALSARLVVVKQLRIAQHHACDLLTVVSQCLTGGLWIVEIAEKSGLVQIEGRALSASAVIDFVSSLQVAGPFDSPFEIVTTSVEPVEGTQVVRFVARSRRPDTHAATSSPAGAGAAAERR